MELILIPEITILTNKFNITYNKKHSGGSFDFAKAKIEIGIAELHKDNIYILGIISHEIMEAILVCLGARYNHTNIENHYLFNFNHQTFETAIQLHTELITKFIKQS